MVKNVFFKKHNCEKKCTAKNVKISLLKTEVVTFFMSWEKKIIRKKLVNWEVNYLVKSLECCSISQLERMRLNWEFLHSVNKKQIYYRSCHFLGKNSFLKNFWCIINKIFHNLQILSWIMHPTAKLGTLSKRE